MFGKRVRLTAVADIACNRVKKAAADYNIKAFKSLGGMLESADLT
jgi:predicted dehydrogenase